MKNNKKKQTIEPKGEIRTIDTMSEDELKKLGEDQQKYKQFLEEMEEYIKREDSKIKKADRTKVTGKYSEAIVFTKEVEDRAIEQIQTLVDSPVSANSQIRIMPDVHSGKGGVIGLTMFNPPVIPNLIGVDIGCGVMMAEIGKIDNLDLKALDKAIRKVLPAGTGVHDKKVHGFGKKLKELKCYDQLVNIDRIERSLGTLGGGNHFLELGYNEPANSYYLTVHTGSRNLGHQVATHYQNLAIEKGIADVRRVRNEEIEALIAELKDRGEQQLIEVGIEGIDNHYFHYTNIPRELVFLSEEDAKDYLNDMMICQEYAHLNRSLILDRVIKEGFKKKLKDLEVVESVHNYYDFSKKVLRKGAISANEGEPLIIPLNMRDGILFGVGKGNPEWNYSAPHGAGRVMSRTQAKDTITLEEFKESVKGVYSSTISNSTIDEAPMAYKEPKAILDNIEETVDIIVTMKPVYSYKG